MKAPCEADVLRACLDLLRLRGLLCWRSNNIPAYDPKLGRYRTFHGLRGVADILAVLPGGKLLACECKGPKGKPTADQEWFISEVNRRGGVACCVRSVAELEAVLGRLGL